MGIKQGRVSMLCQSRSMEKFFFVASLGRPLLSLSRKFCTPQAPSMHAENRYLMGLGIPKDFSTLDSKQTARFWNSRVKLRKK